MGKYQEKLKKDNLEYKIIEKDDEIVIIFDVIKPLKGQPKRFLELHVSEDKIKADLNSVNWFHIMKASLNEIDCEITC